ncbi:MAG: ATP-binding protein, partial [Muribaculaceae bacterium]|nr:ATP-binding protein [Muribaculaceae bacterium]
MERPRNPFILGHRISRPYFCDREEEEKTLISNVINGRNVVLISPRRMGKTSLVYVALHDSEEIEKEYLTFFFDILQTNSLSEFTFLLGKTIFDKLSKKNESGLRRFLAALKSIKGTFGFDPITGTPSFDLQLGDLRNPAYTLDEIFGFLEKSERPVIVVIDEFQQISKYPEKNVEALLRSHIQQMTNASFIFAGSERTLLQEMFVSSNRPFYNSAEMMHLGPIPEDIYIDFARRLFDERNKKLETAPLQLAFSLFDGNTFYLQRTMNGAFADTSEGDICSDKEVKGAIRGMLAANEVIYREILSNVTVSQKAVILAIARDKIVKSPMSGQFIKKHSLPSASSVQSALVILLRSGLIVKEEAGYRINDPLLRIFINNLYSIPE